MNHFKKVIKHCMFYVNHSNVVKSSEYEMIRHFIELMGEEKFNELFEYRFLNENSFEENFYNFHKSMRQTDFYVIGKGHVDMLWWNFIQISDATETILKTYIQELKENKC